MLFQAFTSPSLQLKNRIAMAPMTRAAPSETFPTRSWPTTTRSAPAPD